MTGWFARTLLLVLAGVATLTLIGAIAAIPSTPFIDAPSPTAPAPAPAGATPDDQPGASSPVLVEAAASPVLPLERWAESIAYALIALATFAAAALLVLLRIAGHLGEIARRDRL